MTSLDSLPTWILSSAATRTHQILQAGLGRAGYAGYEYRCLAALAEGEGLSQAQLGQLAALDPRDVTHTLRALEDRALVSRAKDPDHGRRMRVSLTPAGKRAVKRLGAVMTEIQDDAFGSLTKEELATLLRLLPRIGSPG